MGKIIYNSKEVANSTFSYNDLQNKPMINNVELEGNITLRELDVWPIGSVHSSTINKTPVWLGNSQDINGTDVFYFKRTA